ncbi:MAG TPA: AGE family epimerase/isomerase [Brevundimonas sp.]|nr:AGE family epimerase/isomerase [Brevundimonas sp.]
MGIFPVILCGGAGVRLWPSSRPSRPKQFIPLTGRYSLFQQAALRMAPLATGANSRLLVVGANDLYETIVAQLRDVGVDATIILEPVPRNSAPAMVAAAEWTRRLDPDGINIFAASDHEIPNAEAFQVAAKAAAVEAANGRIVNLGVTPTGPSQAYGYIRAETRDRLSPIASFVEKPNAETAELYLAQGYLWNTGVLVTRASILADEAEAGAPGIAGAVRAALPQGTDVTTVVLSSPFGTAPAIAIDHAVMERTDRASVLRVDFDWADLGAWNSVAAAGNGAVGLAVVEESPGTYVRAPEGVVVAVLGVPDTAVIVETDAVLVCALDRAQDVKTVVEKVRALSPAHLDFPKGAKRGIKSGAQLFAQWMRLSVLPLWATLGQSREGAFAQLLSASGHPVPVPRRARVQARQIYVFAEAGRSGWAGAWDQAVNRGFDFLQSHYLRPDGLLRTRLTPNAEPLDDTAMVYDQAFLMLAAAKAKAAGLEGPFEARATAVRDALLNWPSVEGGLVENGDDAYQSNCHMHLFEAAQAWEAVGDDPVWVHFSGRILDLARTRFIDRDAGCLLEHFNSDWSFAGDRGHRVVSPGHQFEWAWLLAHYGRRRGDDDAIADARRLYQFGLRGICSDRGVAVDEIGDDGEVRLETARLWPQTERLKAALVLAELATGVERANLIADAAAALEGLMSYVTPTGLWWDTLTGSGEFVDEPASASTLYHIMAACRQTQASAPVLGFDQGDLSL